MLYNDIIVFVHLDVQLNGRTGLTPKFRMDEYINVARECVTW